MRVRGLIGIGRRNGWSAQSGPSSDKDRVVSLGGGCALRAQRAEVRSSAG